MRLGNAFSARLSAAFFAALSVGFFAPGIFRGEVPVFRDLLVLVIPLRSVARTAIHAGVLPLWTDDLFFGAPFLANYQSAVLYPPSILIYALPFASGLSVFFAFHFFVAGWGMARYLGRRCNLGVSESVFGGLVFAFGGFFTSLVPLVNHLEVAAWLPWVLEAGEELRATGGRRWFVWLTVLVCLQALGGAPEAFLLTGAVLAARVLVVSYRAPGTWRRLPAFLASFALAIGLAAVQLLPTAEYAMQTARASGLSLDQVTAESLAPSSFLQLLIPHTFSGTTPNFVPEGGVPLFWSLYVGVIPIALAVVAVALRPFCFWSLALALSIALSLGAYSPVFAAIHSAAPRLVGAFRFPGKFFLVAHLSLAVLAASGLSLVLREPARRRVAGFVLALVAVSSAGIAWAGYSMPEGLLRSIGFRLPGPLSRSAYEVLAGGLGLTATRSAILALLAFGLSYVFARDRLARRPFLLGLLLLTAMDLVLIHRPMLAFTEWEALRRAPLVEASAGERLFHYCTRSPGCLPPGAPGLGPWGGVVRPGEEVLERARSLWAALVPDAPMVYGLGAVAGSDGFSTRGQEEFFRALAVVPRDRAIHLLASLGVSHLVGTEPLPEAAAEAELVRADSNVWQYAIRGRAPRAYVAARVLVAPDTASALERVAATDFTPGVDAVLIGSSEREGEGTTAAEVTSVSFSPGHVGAALSLSRAGVFVVSDTWLPGWSAALDGVPTSVIQVNGVLRGVRVPAGIHGVEMRYDPSSFRVGRALSAASAVLLLAIGVHAALRRSAGEA